MKILSKVNNLNNNLIFKIKKVIYSALLGNYDSLKKFIKQEDFDYFLFTDILIKKQTNWTIIKIPDIVINLNMDIIKKQRFVKRLNCILIYFLRIIIYLYMLIQIL